MTSPKPSRSSSTVRKMTPSPAEELRDCCCEAAPTIHYLHTTRRTRYTWRFEHERMTFHWSDGVRIADTSIFCDARRAACGRKLPPRAEAEAQLVAAVERALDDGVTPVVLAPALGAAQEVVALFAAAALPVRVHPRIAAWLDAYARIGLPLAT